MAAKKRRHFVFGFAIILGTLGWLGYSGIQESKTYYVTVPELLTSRDAHQRRYRVAGDVTSGSLQRVDGRTRFTLEEEGKLLPVVYTGSEPLPDTLVDGAQAMADGRFQEDGTFYAETVQAKCASKYEPAEAKAGTDPGRPSS